VIAHQNDTADGEGIENQKYKEKPTGLFEHFFALPDDQKKCI
jgi:hypothetical protein